MTLLLRVLIILTFCFTSCSTSQEENTYLNKMGITLTDKYETISSKTSPAIGEQITEFELKISNKDAKAIRNKIEKTENFQILNPDDSPNRSYVGPNKNIEIVGWEKGNSYALEIHKNNSQGVENYILYLDTNNILKFQYADE